MTTSPRLIAVAGVLAATVVLAGCTAGNAPTPTAPPVSESPSSPAPTPDATASALPVGDPTCETIIPADTAEDFKDLGWSAQVETFRIGQVELTDGIQCTWGDYSVATDHVQIFGWAPIEPSLADSSQSDLLADGWRREDGPEGIYITESTATAIAPDSDGYGITYLFGPGWVKIADTKQGLLLVEWPPR